MNTQVPLKIIHPDHFELLGEGYVILTAPHVADAELYTGQIVEDAALVARGYAVMGKASHEYEDASGAQAVQTELHKAISTIIADNDIRYILDVHGKTDSGVEIETGNGLTASESVTHLVRDHLSSTFKTTVSRENTGPRPGSIIATHSAKRKDGSFAVEAIQIQFGNGERHSQRDKVVNAIAELVALINGMHKPADRPKPAGNS